MTAFVTAYLIVSLALTLYLVRMVTRQHYMLLAWHRQTARVGGELRPHSPARQQERARCG